MTNLFREAKRLLDKKDNGSELTEEELKLINTAIIPLMIKTDGVFPNDITIGEGLEELAQIVERANGDEKPKKYERASLEKKFKVRERATPQE